MASKEKKLGRVAVVMGGTSAEREVSLMSGSGVLKALRDANVDAEVFDPQEQDIEELVSKDYDRAFLILHGKGGEDGVIQGLMEYIKLPYTGSGVFASAISIDKVMTKKVWESVGLPVSRGTTVTADSNMAEIIRLLGKNLIVKPSKEGSSIGLYRINDATPESLLEAVRKATEDGMQVMVEELVVGRELTVAVLDKHDGQGLKALPIIEIVAPKGDYDYEHKYFSDETQYICPAAVRDDVRDAILAAVEKAAAVLGIQGWSRVDVMLRPDGSFVLLEINTAPGMTPHSLVPLAAKTVGLSYQELVCLVAEGAALKG
ncbi:MAG: D-alanine--D-alanine ligase [Burkholderiales bacterium]|nr:D-alanine--D-alanine ligase [Burkholderiales bacterium]